MKGKFDDNCQDENSEEDRRYLDLVRGGKRRGVHLGFTIRPTTYSRKSSTKYSRSVYYLHRVQIRRGRRFGLSLLGAGGALAFRSDSFL